MPIYLPKTIVPIKPTRATPLFFFAGPVRGGGGWQMEMAELAFARNSNAHIAIPCRWGLDHPGAHLFYAPFGPAPNRQLHWERHYMNQCGRDEDHGCLVFWLGLESKARPHPGPEPYAMDTRREIGKWTAILEHSGANIVVGAHPDFYGLSVIKDELDDAWGGNFPIQETIADTINAAYSIVL